MQKVSHGAQQLCVRSAGLRVGIFDSGVGGLNVLGACMRRLPDCRYYYYGDNRHAPYGSRSEGEILCFVRAALKKFRRLGVDAAVLACNTATAVCAERMRAEFSFPVIGMEPAVAPAARLCNNVLVLATPLTADSARLHALLARFPDCRFTVCPLPNLAGAIERYFALGERLTISDHLPPGHFDGVVLGCTHYPFFGREIGEFYRAPVFDGADGTANRLFSVLIGGEESDKCGTGDHHYPKQNPNKCFTKIYTKRQKKGVIFLGNAQKINKKVYFSNICFKNK